MTNWVSVACSADGTRLAALVADGGAVYTSTNAGAAWTLSRPPTGLVSGSYIASSADGKVLVAASTRDATGQFAGDIFVSTNSGQTWFTAGAGFKTWTGVASSADGSRLVGISAYRRGFGGGIATSIDSGVTWSFTTAPSVNVFYQGVGSSADGNKLMALNGTIISSPDGGATWGTTSAPGSGWISIASSADGSRWIVASAATTSGSGGPIYLSTDSGAAWVPTSAPITNWSSIACSSNASTLVAVGGGISFKGWIYVSQDSGATWTPTQAPFAHWTSVACSADGTRMVATAYGGQVYTSSIGLSPVVLNPISAPAAATYGSAFTFRVPATTFVDPDGDPLTYTASGMPPGITFDGSTRTFSGTPAQAGVFPVTVVATDTGTPNMSATNIFPLTVNPAILTVTAQPHIKVYGSADPALTFTVTGLQFADTQDLVLTGTLTRTAGETVAGSPYAIAQGTLAASSNYTLNFTSATLAIAPAPLSVTANPEIKPYGAADPPFAATYAGFVNGETAVVLGGTITFTRATGENVGNYAITPSGLTAANYALTFNSGTLAITPADLTVNANHATKTYGTADPALTFTVGGLQFSDTQASVFTGALTRTPGESVAGSPYAVTQGTLAANGNYTMFFTGNALTISPAPLSITADSKTKIYGTADPVFTATYAGFVNGETAAVLGGTITFIRASGEDLGSYIITPSGLTSSNYAITFSNGLLTITAPAPVLLPLSATGAGNVLITWTAVSNATYRVQFASDLNNWSDLSGDVTATGSTASKTDPLVSTNRFYRIQLVP